MRLNPKDFKKGELAQSIFTGKIYEVVEPDKKGMAKLINTGTGIKEDWNACNNPHFKKFDNQYSLPLV